MCVVVADKQRSRGGGDSEVRREVKASQLLYQVFLRTTRMQRLKKDLWGDSMHEMPSYEISRGINPAHTFKSPC